MADLESSRAAPALYLEELGARLSLEEVPDGLGLRKYMSRLPVRLKDPFQRIARVDRYLLWSR